MSLAQLKNNGDLEATGFSEISYAGKGDKSTIYINTNILPKDVKYFKIRKTYNDLAYPADGNWKGHASWTFVSPASYIFGFITRPADSLGVEYIYCGVTSTAQKLLTGLVENEIYDYVMDMNEAGYCNYLVTRVSDGVVLFTGKFSIVQSDIDTIMTAKIHIFNDNWNDGKSNNKVYSFTINNETWYINNGSGNTITGSNGTVLTVNGTLTNFWQISDIWNEDANLKMYKGNSSYYGSFNGTNNYVDMGFKPVDITATKPFEIKFKHKTPISEVKVFSTYSSVGGLFFQVKILTNGGVQYLTQSNNVTFSLAQIGSYANGWLKVKIENSGGGSFLISLWGFDVNDVATQISTTQSISIVTLPDYNIFLACYANNGAYVSVYLIDIAYIKGNGQEWYFNSGSGALLTGNLGTQLTINGTLTSFWQVADFWNKPLNEGLVKCEEFNEVATTYAGKGDGSSVYIDTGIPANTIDNFEIIFKQGILDGTLRHHFAVRNGTSAYYQDYNIINNVMFFVGDSGSPSTLASMVVGNTYKRQIIKISSLVYQCILTNLTTNTIVQDYTYNPIGGSIPDKNLYIYARNTFDTSTISGYTQDEIYSFTINSQTWDISRGYGNTITGSLGTVLNISGTLHNFWQVNTRTVDQYCGKGNGTNISINTNILPKDVTYFKIRKTYNKCVTPSGGHGCYNSITGYGESDFMVYTATTYVYGQEQFWCSNVLKTVFGLVENTIYDYIIELTENQTKVNYYVIDVLTNITVYSSLNNVLDKTRLYLMTNKLYICVLGGLLSYLSRNKVYSFTINDETWYINNGTGTTITGDLGTVLTVSGTTTSFWQPSEIWNDPAQMKLLANEVDIKNEILEI